LAIAGNKKDLDDQRQGTIFFDKVLEIVVNAGQNSLPTNSQASESTRICR
jgi:hypothetical protein